MDENSGAGHLIYINSEGAGLKQGFGINSVAGNYLHRLSFIALEDPP